MTTQLIKDIANISNISLGLGIASAGMNLAKKKKPSTKDFLSTGTGIIVGSSLLKTNADIIAGL